MSLSMAIRGSGVFSIQAVGTSSEPDLHLHLAHHVSEDERNVVQKVCDKSLSFLREALSDCALTYWRLTASADLYDSPTEPPVWKQNSQGLFLFLSGLNSHPSIWNSQRKILETYDQYDTFTPFIPFSGNCSLEQAARPLLYILLDYIKKKPKNPICLCGFSNGSRIAMWLEVQLRERAPHTPVRISTIAGVHYGTKIVSVLQKWGLSKWVLHKDFEEEVKFASPKAKDLVRRVREVHTDPRSYQLFATREDPWVDLESSLPHLSKGEEVHIVHGQGHGSLVSAVAEQQVKTCLDWLQDWSPKTK